MRLPSHLPLLNARRSTRLRSEAMARQALDAIVLVVAMGMALAAKAEPSPAPAKPGAKKEESVETLLSKAPVKSVFRDLKPTDPEGRDPFSPPGYVKPKIGESGKPVEFKFVLKPIGPHGNQAYLEEGVLLEEGKAYPFSELGEPASYTVNKITGESVTVTYKDKSYTFPYEFLLKPKSLLYGSAILEDGTSVDIGAEYPYKDKNGVLLGTYKVLAITENDISVSYKGNTYSFPFVQGDLNQFQEK